MGAFRFVVCLGLFLGGVPNVFAQKTDTKPVSVSYENLTKCFPGLKNEAWTFKVDLNPLKEEIDRHFVTSQSLLRYRQVLLKDASGQLKRLKLSAKTAKQNKFSYVLSLEKIDSKGVGTPVDIPQSHRINPVQKDLDQYFLAQELVEDEYSYFDTKLNGMTLSYKRNLQSISELELVDSRHKKRLLCEDKKDLGVVCTCFQK